MSTQPVVIKEVIESTLARYPSLDVAKLSSYIQQVLEWNPRVGMISRRDPERTIARLVADSVFLWDQMRKVLSANAAVRVVDVGSGGGFPGVVWKLLAPEATVLLVERREKKAAFLDRLSGVLGVDRLDVFTGEAAEAFRLKRYRGGFDVGVTMAVSDPERSSELVADFLDAHGVFVTLIAKAMEPPRRLANGFLLTRLVKAGPSPCAVYRKS